MPPRPRPHIVMQLAERDRSLPRRLLKTLRAVASMTIASVVRSVTIAGISRRSGFARSTTRRHLSELIRRGWLRGGKNRVFGTLRLELTTPGRPAPLSQRPIILRPVEQPARHRTPAEAFGTLAGTLARASAILHEANSALDRLLTKRGIALPQALPAALPLDGFEAERHRALGVRLGLGTAPTAELERLFRNLSMPQKPIAP